MSFTRPKGWEEAKASSMEVNCSGAMDVHFQPASQNEARYYSGGYEDGAEAMLEGLFRMAGDSPTGTFVIDSRERCIYGEARR